MAAGGSIVWCAEPFVPVSSEELVIHRKARQSGFSLIEIMVVMAIILVLSAITASAVMRTIASGKITACASNLHQISTAIDLYCESNNGYFPPYVFNDGYQPPDGNGSSNEETAAFISCLRPYIKDSRIWFCPLDSKARHDVDGFSANHLYSSYEGSIEVGILHSSPHGAEILNLDSPESSDMGRAYETNKGPIMFDLVNYDAARNVMYTSHGLTSNYLYLDGHIKNEPTPKQP